MNKIAITLVAVLAIAFTAEAAPKRDRHSGRREPPRKSQSYKHSRSSKKSPSWGWGLNLTSEGLSLGVGARVGKHGSIGINIPLFSTEPAVEEKTVIVQQPVVQQPIVVQQPVYTVTETAAPARVWVEGRWKIVRDAYGTILSKEWIPAHWE